MWNKFKRSLWVAFDDHSHLIAASLYICTAIHEYYMTAFDLSQLIIYGGLPPAIFVMFHVQGVKKATKSAEEVMMFMKNHEENIRNILNNIKDLAGDQKEIH